MRISDWSSDVCSSDLVELTRDVLPSFLTHQRCFGAKANRIVGTRVLDAIDIPNDQGGLVALLAEVDLDGRTQPDCYFLPLSLRWDETAVTSASPLLPYTLAKIRKGRMLGALVDSLAEGDFALSMIHHLRQGRELPGGTGRLVFRSDESSVGQESVSQGRSRGEPDPQQKNKN